MNTRFAELADAYADGRLDADQAARLLGYLSESTAALRHLRALAVIDLELRTLAGKEDDDASAFRRQVLARIAANRSGRHFRAEVERRIGAARPRRRLRVPAVPRWLLPLAAGIVVAVIAGLLWSPGAAAPAGGAAPLARIEALDGWVTLERDAQQRTAAIGLALQAGDLLTTTADATVTLRLDDGTRLRLDAEGGLRLGAGDGARAHLEHGRVQAAVTPQAATAPPILSTAEASVRVLGTRFSLSAQPQATLLEVDEGRVALRIPSGREWQVERGQRLRVAAGEVERSALLDLRRRDDPAWQRVPTRAVSDLASFVPGAPPALTRWGGRADRQGNATGRLHVERQDGRWWAIDPEGHPLLLAGVSDIQHVQGLDGAALRRHFASSADWAAAAMSLVAEHGFNAIGGGSEYAPLVAANAAQRRTTLIVSSDDVAEEFARRYLRQHPRLAELADGLRLIQFLAPLLPGFAAHVEAWGARLEALGRTATIAGVVTERHTALDAVFDWPALRAAAERETVLRDLLEGWLAAHGTSWAGATHDDLAAFRLACLAGYRDTVFPLARRAAPGALLLGQQMGLHTLARREVQDTLIAPVDAVALHLIGRWVEDPAQLTRLAEGCGRPFWIDHLFVKGADSGLGNLGNGFEVRTQADRARFYQHHVLMLLQSRVVVGWQWFRYEDVGELAPGVISSNKGLVDRDFKPYQALLDGMEQVNRLRYGLADYFDAQSTR